MKSTSRSIVLALNQEFSNAGKCSSCIFIRKIITDILYMTTVIAVSKYSMCHKKIKHFNISLQFERKMQQNGEVTLVYYKSEDQLALFFTKPLANSKGRSINYLLFGLQYVASFFFYHYLSLFQLLVSQ